MGIRRAGTLIPADAGNEHAWIHGQFGDVTHPVGQKLPNRFGLYDMLRQRLGVVLGRVRRGLLQAVAARRPAGSVPGRGPGVPGRELVQRPAQLPVGGP